MCVFKGSWFVSLAERPVWPELIGRCSNGLIECDGVEWSAVCECLDGQLVFSGLIYIIVDRESFCDLT